MKTNVGGIDRGLRIALGLVLLSLFFVLDGNARWWSAVGFVPLLTGLIGWCPAYPLFGFDTCAARR